LPSFYRKSNPSSISEIKGFCLTSLGHFASSFKDTTKGCGTLDYGSKFI
jgi:hypothetical protein